MWWNMRCAYFLSYNKVHLNGSIRPYNGIQVDIIILLSRSVNEFACHRAGWTELLAIAIAINCIGKRRINYFLRLPSEALKTVEEHFSLNLDIVNFTLTIGTPLCTLRQPWVSVGPSTLGIFSGLPLRPPEGTICIAWLFYWSFIKPEPGSQSGLDRWRLREDIQKKASFFWTSSESGLDPPPSFWTPVR